MHPLASQRDSRQPHTTRYAIFEKKYSLASCKTEVELEPGQTNRPAPTFQRVESRCFGMQIQNPLRGSLVLSRSTTTLQQHAPALNSLRFTTRQRDSKHRSSETATGGDTKVTLHTRSKIFDQSFSKHSFEKLTKSTVDLKHSQNSRPSVIIVSSTSLKPIETVCRIYSDPIEPYCPNILSHMKSHAIVNKCLTNPLKHQEKVNKRMRYIIFNWLLESSHKFKFKPRTIFMAGNVMDRYLSIRQISKEKFQLIGVTCLFIAAKYEEIRPPTAHHMGFLLDEMHNSSDILKTEAEILTSLDFSLHTSLPIDMAEVLFKVFGVKDEVILDLIHQVLVIFACHHHVDRFEPTKLAAFAMAYAAKISRKHIKSPGPDWSISECEFAKLCSKLRTIVLTMHSYKLEGIQKVNKLLNSSFFKP